MASCTLFSTIHVCNVCFWFCVQTLREAIQNILQICLNRNMTSIAIPSLGAGKLGYPHHIIADILFTEVLVFNQQHPAFLQKVVFVLSEKEIYESFMKVYVQQLCVCSSEEVSSVVTCNWFKRLCAKVFVHDKDQGT